MSEIVNLSNIAAVVSETGDAAGNTSTTESMNVGDSFQGSLQTVGDTDWVAITLTSGSAYEIDLNGIGGSAVSDTFLRVYDSSGSLLKSDDDGGPGLNSSLTLTAGYTGTYYIEADSFNNNKTGDYQIDVTETVPAVPTDSLEWSGAAFSTASTINVYFATSGSTVDDEGTTITSDGFTTTEINAIMGMFDGVTDFANINFQRTTNQSAADIQLATDNLGSSLLGYMYPQGSSSSSDGLGVFTSNSTYWNSASMSMGGFMYGVVIHELGHGLGLAHPHDTGGGSDVMDGVTSSGDTGDYGEMNQSVFTVMSYNDGWNGHPLGTPPDYSSGYQATFAALDIAVLQSYYGTNTTHNSGSNRYELGALDYFMTIWDTGGTDRIVVTNNSDAVIDLRAATLAYEEGGAGFVSYSSGTRGGYTIANGVVIEIAVGGGGDDTITGNTAANTLRGRGGNDTLSGGGDDDTLKGNRGRDVLIGGDGDDFLNGAGGADTFRFDLDDGNDDIKKFKENDVIDVSGLGLSYGDLVINISGSTATVSFGTTTLSILNLQADLDASDFLF